MVKAIVIVPPVRDFYFTFHRGSFIGAQIVNKVLQKIGIESEIIIFPMLKGKGDKIPLPNDLEYLRRYIIPDSPHFFKNYYRFGNDFDFCAKLISSRKPEIVFLSCFAFGYALDSIELAKSIRSKSKKIVICVGGSGVTVYPEYFLNSGVFDHVISGNAEESIPKMFKLTYQNNFEFLFSHTKKIKNSYFYSTVLTRGCPKCCDFCSNHITQGRKLRIANIDNVLEEFEKLPKDESIHLNFEDDNVLFKKTFFFELLLHMKKSRVQITFSCENGIDFMFLDKKDIDFLVNIGFTQFNFSMVSNSSDILKNNHREQDFSQLEQLIFYIKEKFNKPIFLYIIAGLKGDTFENLKNLLHFLYKLPVIIGISPFYPVPGIKGYEDRSFFDNHSPILTLGSSFFPWNNSLSTDELISLFKITRDLNLSKLR